MVRECFRSARLTVERYSPHVCTQRRGAGGEGFGENQRVRRLYPSLNPSPLITGERGECETGAEPRRDRLRVAATFSIASY